MRPRHVSTKAPVLIKFVNTTEFRVVTTATSSPGHDVWRVTVIGSAHDHIPRKNLPRKKSIFVGQSLALGCHVARTRWMRTGTSAFAQQQSQSCLRAFLVLFIFNHFFNRVMVGMGEQKDESKARTVEVSSNDLYISIFIGHAQYML